MDTYQGTLIRRNTMYDANSLLSIVNFWGEDITPEQETWLMNESDDLPRNEQEKFLDLRVNGHLPRDK